MGLLLTTLTLLVALQPATRPRADLVTTLELPAVERFAPNNHAFRSVALGLPYVYVGDREGDLYVFKIDPAATGQRLRAIRVIHAAVNEGVYAISDVDRIGDALLITGGSGLRVFSLAEPSNPVSEHDVAGLERLGPNGAVLAGDRLFLLGEKRIAAVDVSNPHRPALLATAPAKGAGVPYAGCVIANRLYVTEWSEEAASIGVGVYDVSAPNEIRRTGFVQTTTPGYAVHLLGPGQLVVALDSPNWILSGDGPHGSVAFLDVSKPDAPQVFKELGPSGGRTSAMVTLEGARYLVCPGETQRIDFGSLISHLPCATGGSNLDGLPYHSAVEGNVAALPLDDIVAVIRVSPPAPHQ